MATPFDLNVALRRPPHTSGGGGIGPTLYTVSTSSAASTTAQDVLGSSTLAQSYVVMRFGAPTAALGAIIGYIVFGPSGLNDATSAGWPIAQGEVWEWLCLNPGDRYFKMLRAGADNVTCIYYRSDVTG